jgi:hypothetical protein
MNLRVLLSAPSVLFLCDLGVKSYSFPNNPRAPFLDIS